MTKRERKLFYGLGGAIALWWIFREGEFVGKRYIPGSDKAKELFRFAAESAGLPIEWGDSPDLHYILKRESGGWVGRPNYTFGSISSTTRSADWHTVWNRLKAGDVWTKSTATGLGQLLTSNAKKFYPDGLVGIGDPVNEAVGMLKYIASRYGSPKVARSVYAQKKGYVHAITGKSRYKGFREGY